MYLRENAKSMMRKQKKAAKGTRIYSRHSDYAVSERKLFVQTCEIYAAQDSELPNHADCLGKFELFVCGKWLGGSRKTEL